MLLKQIKCSPTIKMMGLFDISYGSIVTVSLNSVNSFPVSNLEVCTFVLSCFTVLCLQILGTVATYGVIVIQFSPLATTTPVCCPVNDTLVTSC